ncbi:MAG: hypothetical protein RIT45_722 [Pseudomonadota bacterium]
MTPWARRLLALALAIVFAGLLFVGLGWLLDRRAPPPEAVAVARARADARARASRRVSTRLRATTPRKTERTARVRPELEKEREKEKKKLEPVEKPDGQIVETARPESEERPQNARYLGRYDMKVEREQKSKGKKRKGRELGHVQIDNPSELQSPTSKSKAPTQIASRNRARQRRVAKQKAEAKAAAQKAAQPGMVAKQNPEQVAPPTEGPGAAPGGEVTSPVVRPSVVRGGESQMLLPSTSPGNVAHNLQALAGSPGSDDYLPDVDDEGDTNLLNTRKFRYWDFFQRIRERVRNEWNPTAVWRARDPTGRRFGVRDRLTIVRVTLDQEGSVKALRVHKPSGLGFLDDEATRAFSAGGPYPNPPAGLVNERGEVEFQFGFMFEISSSRFRFYRMDR